jgi:hypothetical protein
VFDTLQWAQRKAISLIYKRIVHNHENSIMNQERHLLALLTMMLQAILDGCLPVEDQIRRPNTFVTTHHSVHGAQASLSTSHLTDWVFRICLGIQSTPVASPTLNFNKRGGPPTPVCKISRPAVLPPALRYVVFRMNGHYHGADNHLMYNVTWYEPGSSDTLGPYSNIHHLDTLAAYGK